MLGDCGAGTRNQSELSRENHLYKLWLENIGILIFKHLQVTVIFKSLTVHMNKKKFSESLKSKCNKVEEVQEQLT